MKTKYLIPAIASFFVCQISHGLTFSGTAATSAGSATVAGNSSFIIVDTNDDGIDFFSSSLGVTLTSGSFIGTSDDYIIAYNAVAGGFGTSISGNASFTLGSNSIDENDDFYILFFADRSGDGITTQAGDSFGFLQEANWFVPGNNAGTFQFGTAFTQITDPISTVGTVVPEPSTYAALSGLLALSSVMLRRRRA
jgi:hypothetical protein